MARINDHFLKLKAGYLFPEIGRRVREYQAAHPDAKIIRMGIGDVTEPLPEACRIAMMKAIDDQGKHETFQGYGPEQGYPWLREAIAANDYRSRGCDIAADEVFVSDSSKCDCANILDIFAAGKENTIAVTDPVYPVYVDTNVMAGNTGEALPTGGYGNIVYLPLTAENQFTAQIPTQQVDLIYLCFPNNPTGATATREHLEQWVRYALEHKSIILYDAAYEAFITDASLPHSIFEIDGARQCAIEFRSFSKNAGFTGTRCAFTVVPKGLTAKDAAGNDVQLHKLWLRRQTTKFNGVSYIIQRGAEAVYNDAGREQVRKLVSFYLGNAALLRMKLTKLGFSVHGGINAPYLWIKTPRGLGSWEFFDDLLQHAHVVGTPGAGFGAAGEGYFRLSAFNSRANVEEALDRIAKMA